MREEGPSLPAPPSLLATSRLRYSRQCSRDKATRTETRQKALGTPAGFQEGERILPHTMTVAFNILEYRYTSLPKGRVATHAQAETEPA